MRSTSCATGARDCGRMAGGVDEQIEALVRRRADARLCRKISEGVQIAMQLRAVWRWHMPIKPAPSGIWRGDEF